MKARARAPKINTVSFGFNARHGFPQVMAACDQHNEIELNFIAKGEMSFRRGVETVTLSAGDTILYWAAVPHQILSVKPKTELCWFIVPLSTFLGWKLPEDFTHRLLHGGLLFLKDRPGHSSLQLFQEWIQDYSSKSAQVQMAMKLEFEAYFRRLAVEQEHAAASSPIQHASEGPHNAHVERMVNYITNHFTEPLTVEDISRIAHLNPEYAMRIFRDRWGITIGKFLLHQRISEAQRLLLLSDAPLIDVAYACGFQSLSRFYQAFKEQCHCSPGAYRRQHEDRVSK